MLSEWDVPWSFFNYIFIYILFFGSDRIITRLILALWTETGPAVRGGS